MRLRRIWGGLGMSFRKLTLGDLCLLGDGAHTKVKRLNTGVPYLTSKNIKNGYIDLEKIDFISEEDFEKLFGHSQQSVRHLQKGDLLMGIIGTLGNCYLYKQEDRFGISSSVAIIRPNLELVLPKFLYYYATSKTFLKYIEMFKGGSVQGYTNLPTLRKIPIYLPALPQQKSIAKILSFLDEKIEVNNEINKKLEEMAQAIYKQWFVDFEFLNEEGKPYQSSGGAMVESELGMIPEGWEVKELKELVDSYSGYSYKGKDLGESADAMVTIKNFNRTGGFKLNGLKEIVISERVKPHHIVELNDIIVAHTDLTQRAEIIGNPIIILTKGKYRKLIMSMDTVKVLPKANKLTKSVLYFLLKDKRFKQYALGYVNGTTVLHLSKKTIPQYKLSFPKDQQVIRKLDAILSVILDEIATNINESEKLSIIKETLLPKLMSGEIRVPVEEH